MRAADIIALDKPLTLEHGQAQDRQTLSTIFESPYRRSCGCPASRSHAMRILELPTLQAGAMLNSSILFILLHRSQMVAIYSFMLLTQMDPENLMYYIDYERMGRDYGDEQ
jgi:hypothetical protein